MKEIVPKNSRYTPLVQQKSCCVPASISMVMLKRGIPLLPQELLGYHLGLVIRPDQKHLFWSQKSGKKPKSGYGTQVYNPKYEPNKVFKKLKIPLKFKLLNTKNITEDKLTRLLRAAEKEDQDILVCFNHGHLTGSDENYGHVCVFDRLIGKNKIRLIDPSQNEPKWNIITVKNLVNAIKHHTMSESALWQLEKI